MPATNVPWPKPSPEEFVPVLVRSTRASTREPKSERYFWMPESTIAMVGAFDAGQFQFGETLTAEVQRLRIAVALSLHRLVRDDRLCDAVLRDPQDLLAGQRELRAVDRREQLLHVPALNGLVARAALIREDLLDEPAGALLTVALENHVERLRRVLLRSH